MSTSILELDEVIRRYAWNVLKKRCNFLRRFFLDESDFVCEIDWSAISMEHKVAKFESKEDENTTIDTNWGKVVTGSKWVSLWSCDFENKADLKQSHTFRGSRNTTTWVDVDIEQCYTIKKELDVEVNIPPNLSKFRAGRDNSLHINKIKGQVFKEILTWEVNSQVEVLPSWQARAELLAREECSSMEFEIRTTLYNPSGILPVYFKRKADRRNIYVVELENFANAFQLEEEEGGLKPEEKQCFEVMIQRTLSADGEEAASSCHPQLITKGSCVCLTWGDQKVDIRTAPLNAPAGVVDGDGSTYYDSNSGPINITTRANSNSKNRRSWRGGSDGNSASSSLGDEGESTQVKLISNNVNGTIVSSLEDNQFVVTSQ
ncbi:protein CBR-LIN-24 [Elysia marginata]|uniref:Protein CBR-LIN-24 n=1 Tax=Elysia marginata TaxID=1093978 RepID=A0AAV4EZX7_9GAST|nr:protein CBR-LIN-24 [Elysia marginata]